MQHWARPLGSCIKNEGMSAGGSSADTGKSKQGRADLARHRGEAHGASGLEVTAQGGGGRQAGRRSAPGQSRSAQGGVRAAGLGPVAGSARVGELGGVMLI